MSNVTKRYVVEFLNMYVVTYFKNTNETSFDSDTLSTGSIV